MFIFTDLLKSNCLKYCFSKKTWKKLHFRIFFSTLREKNLHFSESDLCITLPKTVPIFYTGLKKVCKNDQICIVEPFLCPKNINLGLIAALEIQSEWIHLTQSLHILNFVMGLEYWYSQHCFIFRFMNHGLIQVSKEGKEIKILWIIVKLFK